MNEREFDVVVLGAGSAGEVCAGRLGEGGLSVAIVEPGLVGGECSYFACMPSKALLRPAELLAEARRVPGVREHVDDADLDPAVVFARRDEAISNLDDSGQLPWLEQRGVELIRGEGKLGGERRVVVGDQLLSARKAVVIATGTSASAPPIDGLDDLEVWTNREGTTASEVPASLLVLGGGPVGSELAQAWSSLGAKVTLVEAAPGLLPREEPFAGEEVAKSMRERFAVDLRLGVKAAAARRGADGIELELEGGETIAAERIMIAAGRRPRTDQIGLESAGIEPGGYLEVDDQLRVTDNSWLYAVGDVNGRALLTHMGKYQGRLAADHILGKEVAAVAEAAGPPRVTFTDPQVAAVGLTLADAKQRGIAASAMDASSSATAGGSFQGKGEPGTSRLVVDEESNVLVGATFVGFETADWIHAATIAVIGEVSLDRLWHAIPAFPTRSEVWLKLMEAYGL